MNIDVHLDFSGATVRVVSLHPVQNNVDVQSLLLVGQVSLCVYVQRERGREGVREGGREGEREREKCTKYTYGKDVFLWLLRIMKRRAYRDEVKRKGDKIGMEYDA